MIKDQKVWALEKAYLDRVTREIKAQLDRSIDAADNYKSDAIKLQKSMWEDVRCAPSGLFDLEDAAQINQIQMELSNKAGIYRFSQDAAERLKRMAPSPYFGRIDFLENGDAAAERIYIGAHHLAASESMDILVYDWRAPVSGMFYDFETGPSSYVCPAGLIEGRLLLKRQYKIEDAVIVYMFDSSLSINDAMLQEILGKSADSQMRTIVTSIQKEQNTVIRNSRDRILVVEGPAGSGKTSIALHRAAYLLYKYRDTMKSENILIFSPNHVFEDYISHVLPELGEDNIRRSTFAGFFKAALGAAGKQAETIHQQIDPILNAGDPGEPRLKSMRFKASPLFLAALKRYVQSLEEGAGLRFEALSISGALLISAGGIEELYRSQYHRLPYANRLEKIRRRLFGLLQDDEKKRIRESSERGALNDESGGTADPALREEYRRLQDAVLQMTAFDIVPLYIGFFKDIEVYTQAADENAAAEHRGIAAYSLRELERGIIHDEDFAPLVYLKTVLEADHNAGAIKHVIIDEAQDYTPVQMEIFKAVFQSCNMTILGDINQTVNGYMNIGSFDALCDAFETGVHRITLTKSYRSSKELADFCGDLLGSPGRWEQLNRHGAKPRVIKADKSVFVRRIAGDIVELKQKGYKRIAVICKTAAQCRAVCRSVGAWVQMSLVSDRNEGYHDDVVVIPSYLAKGLEFDAVLVNSIEDTDYWAPEHRRLLYTVCTRALHELYLYYFDTMSAFVACIDKKRYD